MAELRAATKRDLAELRAATQADIAELRAETAVSLSNNKVEILKWVFAGLIAQAGVIISAVKLIRSERELPSPSLHRLEDFAFCAGTLRTNFCAATQVLSAAQSGLSAAYIPHSPAYA